MKGKLLISESIGAVHTHTHTLGHTKEKLWNRRKSSTQGITLVALVVTIVVLLILAGITIMYTMGENSIFKKAQEAKNKTEEAVKNEQEYLEELANKLKEEYGDNTVTPPTQTEPTDAPIENIKGDWAIIEKIAKEIAKDDSVTSETEEVKVVIDGKRYTIKPGDIFEVEYNGEVRRVRVLGFKHDDLVDQTVYGGTHEKASISFEFYDCLGTHNMNGTSTDTSTNVNGWATTEMRTFLEGLNGRGQLNNNSYIKQVKKQYIKTYNDASSVTISNDYLWLLSSSEIFNDGNNGGDTRGYAITKEGEQYLYYKNNAKEAYNISSTNRIKYSKGNADYWWLRSPAAYSDVAFDGLIPEGMLGNGTGWSFYDFGVAPGFCI